MKALDKFTGRELATAIGSNGQYDLKTAAGKAVAAGEILCTVESVKAVSDVYAPVAGTVGEGNADLEADPAALNADPENTWICKLEGVNASDLGGLMDADAYAKFVESL